MRVQNCRDDLQIELRGSRILMCQSCFRIRDGTGGPAPVSTRRGPQPGGLAVCCANRCRGRGRHHRRSTGSGMGPAVDRNRSRRGSLGYHRYCGYADSPARSHTPSCGAAARATSPCADGATTGTTAPGGAACAAVPGGARPGGRAGQTSAAVAERSRRHRGPRRAVATWPSLCLGRNGAQPVRLFRFGPVGLRPGGCSPGSHHLSTDQRGDPGSSRTMRLCWPATKDSRSPRCPGSWCTCRSHRLAHNRPLDARSASPAVAKPSVIRLGSRVRRRSGSPDHLPSARICVSSRRSPRRLLWCYRRPLARCSESTIR